MDVAALALRIDSADIVSATAELDKFSAASNKAGVSAKAPADGLSRSAQAAINAAASVDRYAGSSARMAAEARLATRGVDDANRQWERASVALRNVEPAANQAVNAMTRVNTATRAVNDNSGQARAGLQQLGFQLGDAATMFSMGARPAQIFGTQLGQTLQAVQLMTGGTSRLAAFLGGPWGIAISVGAIALTPLISKLFETKDAAEVTATALQKAMQALDASLATMSPMSTAMTEATKERVAILADIGRINREIAEIDRRAAAASGTRYLSQGSPAFNQRQRLVEERQAAEARVRSVDAEMRGAISAAQAVARQHERIADAERAANPRSGGASRATSLSEEARALQERTRATDQYIASLTDEVARIGLSEEALRQYEVAQALSRATTDAQREAIAKLNTERERGLSTLKRQQELETAQKAVEATRAGITSGVDIELQTMGLVGAEREREILRLQRQIELTDILAKIRAAEAAGNVELADTYRQLAEATDEEFAKRMQVINSREAIDEYAESMNAAREVARGFFSDWIQGVRDGENIFKSFEKAVLKSLSNIIDQLIEAALQQMLFNSIAGAAGGGAGAGGGAAGQLGTMLGTMLGVMLVEGIGSLFADGGAFGTAQRYAHGGAFGTAQRFANGAAFTNSIVTTPTLFRFAKGAKLGLMGEEGPEAIMPLSRGPNGKLGVAAHGGRGGGRNGDVNVENHYHVSGAIDQTAIVAMIRQGGQATYDQVKRDLEAMLAQLDRDGVLIN